MPRIVDFTKNPPELISSGAPFSSLGAAIVAELENLGPAAHDIRNTDISGVIDQRKMESPLFPVPIAFHTKQVALADSVANGATYPVPAGNNVSNENRYQVIDEICLPDMGDAAKVDFYLIGADCYPGTDADGINPALGVQSSVDAFGRDDTVDSSIPNSRSGFRGRARGVEMNFWHWDELVPSFQIFWTEITDGSYTFDDMLPLTSLVEPVKGTSSLLSGRYRIGPESVLGDGMVRLRDGGVLLPTIVLDGDNLFDMPTNNFLGINTPGQLVNGRGHIMMACGYSLF